MYKLIKFYKYVGIGTYVNNLRLKKNSLWAEYNNELIRIYSDKKFSIVAPEGIPLSTPGFEETSLAIPPIIAHQTSDTYKFYVYNLTIAQPIIQVIHSVYITDDKFMHYGSDYYRLYSTIVYNNHYDEYCSGLRIKYDSKKVFPVTSTLISFDRKLYNKLLQLWILAKLEE